ncbi:hypothetical protein KCP76_13050 [Salmonella enterica subsp. enterica serovar Weltevreden]|nr:hypothetical protein KCP76_13050 [Salmonella enterica subsp. enterica serovar Weltevreden]
MVEVALNIVQQTVHQRQTTGARTSSRPTKAFNLEILSVAIKVIQIVSLLHVTVGFNQKLRSRRPGPAHFTRLRPSSADE